MSTRTGGALAADARKLVKIAW